MCNYSSQVPIDDISGCIATSDSQLNNCSGSTVDDIVSILMKSKVHCSILNDFFVSLIVAKQIDNKFQWKTVSIS